MQVSKENRSFLSAPSPAAADVQAVRSYESFSFRIQEECIQQDGGEALLITLHSQPPMSFLPEALVDPATYAAQPFACHDGEYSGKAPQGDFCFWYSGLDD